MQCSDCQTVALENDYLCFLHRKEREKDKGQLYDVAVESYDQNAAPPTEIMRIARVGDIIFFEIKDYDEGTYQTRQIKVATFGVKLRDLKQALDALNF